MNNGAPHNSVAFGKNVLRDWQTCDPHRIDIALALLQPLWSSWEVHDYHVNDQSLVARACTAATSLIIPNYSLEANPSARGVMPVFMELQSGERSPTECRYRV